MKRTPLKRGKSTLKRTPLKVKKSLKTKKVSLKRTRIRKVKRNKTPLEKLAAKLWRLFSNYVRVRDNWKCVTCGNIPELRRSLHAGHFIPGTHQYLRYDPQNVNAQCVTCNFHNHGNLAEYAQFIIKRYGVKTFNRIMVDKRKQKKWSVKEFEILIHTLVNAPEKYEKIYYKLIKTSEAENQTA